MSQRRFVRSRVLQSLLALLITVGLLGGVWAVDAQPAAPALAERQPIALRVQTPAYQLDAKGLRVEGYSTNDRPGAPALPVWNTLVELPADGSWELSYDSVGEQRISTGARVASVPVPDPTFRFTSLEAAPSAVPVVERPDPLLYESDSLYPTSLVETGAEQWQRGKRLLPVRVFPFQYNPVTGELVHHPDVHLTFTFRAATPREEPPAWQALIPHGMNPPASLEGSGGALRVYTGERGLHRLTYSDLQGAGVPVDTVDPRLFGMTYLGQPIAIQVTGEADGQFNPADQVIFYAEPYTGRFMKQNVYWFTYGGPAGPRMETRTVTPTGSEPIVTQITQTLHIESNTTYVSNLERPNDQDHFYDTALYPSTGAPTRTVTYNDLAFDDPLPVGTLSVRSVYFGAFLGLPNSVRLRLNNHLLATYQWSNNTEFTGQNSAPASWLDGSPNQISLESSLFHFPQAQRPPYFAVYPDWIQVEYPALADVETDRLYIEAMAEGAKQVQVTGFTNPTVGVYDIRDPDNPVQLLTTQAVDAGGSYTLSFWDQNLPAPSYWLATPAARLAPVSIVADVPSSWRTPAHSYSYLAIVHASLQAALQPLVAHRTGEGMTVATIDVQDIYDEFSYGLVDPDAIRAFITYAYHTWNAGSAPPEYALLVGDAHYDFKDYLVHPDQPNLLPAYLANVDAWLGETVADNRYVSVDGPDDFLPDIHLGRLTARTPAELTAAVNKIIAYETTTPDGLWQRRAVYVADNDEDNAGNFHLLSDQGRLNALPPLYNDETIYFNPNSSSPDTEYNTPEEVTQAIKAVYDTQALYIQWFGHASQLRWGSFRVFSINNMEELAPNTHWPLSVSYACLSSWYINLTTNGFYNFKYQTLAEQLLMTPERGSIADIGPSGLHVGSSLLVLQQGLTEALTQDRIERVGVATDASRLYFYTHSLNWLDLIDTTLLMGDPATRLRLPPIALESSTMSADDPTPEPGQQVTFTINVTNIVAEPMTNVEIRVDYDQSRMTVTSAGGATNDGDTLIWNEPSIPQGTTVRSFTVTLAGDIPDGTVIDTPTRIRANMENVHLNAPLVVEGLPTATPTATATGTPASPTPTVTGTPPSPTPTATGTISSPTATATGTATTPTATATGTPPTATATGTATTPTATVTGTPPTATPTVTGTPPSPTPTATGESQHRIHLPLILR